MNRTALMLAFLCAAPAAAQQRVHVMSREELGAGLMELSRKLDALRADLDGRDARIQARLDELQKAIDALKAPASGPDLAGRIDELSAALDELKDDAAKKSDLAKYVRKPDEKEFKSRTAEELELRGD